MKDKRLSFTCCRNCSSVGGGEMYSCVDGKTSFIVKGRADFCILLFRFPVVKELKAKRIAFGPIMPSDSMISMFRMSSAGTSSGHPP